jgi:hypothetical protein
VSGGFSKPVSVQFLHIIMCFELAKVKFRKKIIVITKMINLVYLFNMQFSC